MDNNNNNRRVTNEEIADLVGEAVDLVRLNADLVSLADLVRSNASELRLYLIAIGCIFMLLAWFIVNRLNELESLMREHIGMSWIEAHNTSQSFYNNGIAAIKDAQNNDY